MMAVRLRKSFCNTQSVTSFPGAEAEATRRAGIWLKSQQKIHGSATILRVTCVRNKPGIRKETNKQAKKPTKKQAIGVDACPLGFLLLGTVCLHQGSELVSILLSPAPPSPGDGTDQGPKRDGGGGLNPVIQADL